MIFRRLSKKAWFVVIALIITWGLYFLNAKLHQIRQEEEVTTEDDNDSVFRSFDAEVDMADEPNSAAERDVNGAFVIQNPGCSIPRYPTFSDAVLPYLETGKPPVDCVDKYRSKDGPKLEGPPIVSNATHVFVPKPYHGHSCCYSTIVRHVVSDKHWADNTYNLDGDCEKFPSDGSVLHVTEERQEFTKVRCKVSRDGKSAEFEDIHAVPLHKKDVEQRVASKSAALTPEERDNRMNLLILGLDASSRQNFHRQMPQTREFLEELGAVELVGYNKVADNTFPNIVPLMTGLSEKELKLKCWKRAYDPLDDCPWLWHRFEERGYRTALVEDAPNIGIFNFERLGFRKQPSDYYLRPFIMAIERRMGHFNYPSVLLCLGPRLGLQVVFDFISKYCEAFHDSEHPYFAFSWSTTMTHDGLALVREADPIIARELRRSIPPKVRDRTALLFISDHGVRTGEFRETPQGAQEERLPFAFLALPPKFRQKFPRAFDNLQNNGAKRLTTPFDLHLTLVDLLDPKSSLSPAMLKKRTREIEVSSPLPRGMSLFLPVPETRKCQDAGITDHWCTCLTGKAAQDWEEGGTGSGLTGEEAEGAGKALVDLINGILKRKPEDAKLCAHLSLDEVLEAKSNGDEGSGVIVRVRTSPGGAVFEGTLKRKSKWKDTTLAWALGDSGEENVGISRLNLYGNQSACIEDYHLKLFCYCKSQLTTEGYGSSRTT
ncbi:uncharacterized protein LOC124156216 isoform X2 [Ischnura elegans]|nr:uncharacterized protein LOC124156216 isoform X2 [Ischnura elegans]